MPTLQDIFKGLPTANQEALQAPTVDPIVTLANMGVFGAAPALKGLLSQIILNATGGWAAKGNMGQYQMPGKVSDALVDQMYDKGVTNMANYTLKSGGSVDELEWAANNLLRGLDPQKNWGPMLGAASRGWGRVLGKIPAEVFEAP